MFWVDLSQLGLIEGSFSAGSSSITMPTDQTGTIIGTYFPSAKIGQGNYVYAYSGGQVNVANGLNYFAISAVYDINPASNGGTLYENPGLTVQQAYAIDNKIDDGYPQLGSVTAMTSLCWANPGDCPAGGAPYTTAEAGTALSCFDNSATSNGAPGVGGANQHYSLEMNSGAGVNCKLSFRFQ